MFSAALYYPARPFVGTRSSVAFDCNATERHRFILSLCGIAGAWKAGRTTVASAPIGKPITMLAEFTDSSRGTLSRRYATIKFFLCRQL